MYHLLLVLGLLFACGDEDRDGDGYPASVDCMDDDPHVRPNAEEVVYDGLDNDCDASTPDDDLDGDGFGVDEDCDDDDPAVYPGAAEVCDGVDNDCNDIVDDGVGGTVYQDADEDGFGDPNEAMQACEPPEGYVDNDLDCDDGDPLVNPDGREFCNGIDDDCNGLVDDDAYDVNTFYIDYDGDSYGSRAFTLEDCADEIEGMVFNSRDCDDTDADSYPGAPEVCDGKDNDCDDYVDEGTASIDEVCDGVDNDCDGQVDEDPSDGTTWYLDYDGDGYGDPATAYEACGVAPSPLYVTNGDDCDDNDRSVGVCR